MPEFSFQNKKGDVKDFFYESADVPSIGSTIKVGRTMWTRLPSKIQAATDLKVDPFDKQKFLEKTNKTGKIGDIFDRSREMGEARKQQMGRDPLKEKFIESSKKKRNGKFVE